MVTVDENCPYILQVERVFSPDECQELIRRIESLDPQVATINTARGTQVNRDIRNNDRVIFDDEELASQIAERVADRLPRTVFGHKFVGANERFRCYRYLPGMRFAPHADGAFHRNDSEQSFYTVLLYLNEDFEGGATTFVTEPEVSVQPATGKILMFQHPIIHEGCIVSAGAKYVARTDLMYRRSDPSERV